MIIFERKTDWSHWAGRGNIVVGPWASYDESLYPLTLANADRIVIRCNHGKKEKLWTGMYGLGTGCRIDSMGEYPASMFGIEIFTVSCGVEFPVDSKKRVFNTLLNAQVLVEEPEEEQRPTSGWRAI
jgi:hypothetical protein